MKIALYYPWVYLTSGVERVILETVKRSKHKYTIFTNHFDKKNTYPEYENLNVVELSYVPVDRSLLSVLKAAVRIAFQKINLKPYDILFVHSDGLGDLISLRNRKVPIVCFCHTPLRPVFDQYYRKKTLATRKGLSRLFFILFSSAFSIVDKWAWNNYAYVFFNSQETLKRARKGGLLRSLKGRYEVLYPGLDRRVYKPSWQYLRYFLIAGRIMWTKNIGLGIASFIKFKKLSQRYENFELVIAGQVDKKSKPYLKRLRKMVGRRKDIKFIISPSEERLKKLYSECWAIILTSFNEDFGMTLLEGNAYGKPGVVLNRGGPKESQIHGKTGFLVGEKAEEIAQKLGLLAKDTVLLRRLGRLARDNLKKYSWSHFIQRVEAVLERVSQREL